MSRTETKGTTTTKQNTSNNSYLAHKFSPWALNRLLFLRMRYLKWIRIFKRWFNRFFLFSGMKIEFLLHKEKVDLFVCLFSSKMRANKCFFNPFALLVFVEPRQYAR